MQAKHPNGRDARLDKPADSSTAAIPPLAIPSAGETVLPASKLSAAFGAALGGKALLGHIHPASGDGLKPGHGRPDQINKAPKPATGPKKTVSPGHGHR
jgi:hypothetical protein